MRVDSTYPTPILGVSTLSPRNRVRGQAGLQENFRSDPVNKLTRRQSLKWVAHYATGINSDDVKFHSYTRNGKTFDFIITGTEVKAFVNNIERPINNPNGVSIPALISGTTRRSLITQTVNDLTLIANPTKIVQLDSIVDDEPPSVSYLNVLSALNYGETVEITITVVDEFDVKHTIAVNYVVPELGTNPPNYDIADKARATAAVAGGLWAQIILDTSLGLNAFVKGSVLAIQKPFSAKELTIEVLTGQGDRSCVAINNINTSIEGLPLYARPNSTVTIKPNPTSDRGTYYLKATPINNVTSTEALQEVTWVESRSPQGLHKLDKLTLPIELIYDSESNQFTMNYMMLDERLTGDEETNKAPDFVGKRITAISYFQKRLVIVSENTVAMSRTDDLYNFFKKSAVQLLVTDPIGVASTSTEVDFLKHVISHNRDLMFVARNGQFKIDGSVAITPQTVSMPLTTAYECTTSVPPVSMGNSVLLPITYGNSAGIQEYRKEKNVDNDVAHPLTHHIINYMKGDVTNLVANGNLETCILTTSEGGHNCLFVFEQYSEFGEHRQRSWSKWVLPDDTRIIGLTFEDSIIRVLTRDGSNLVMKEIELYAKVTSEENEVFLDNRLQFDAFNFFELPNGYQIDDSYVLIGADDSFYPLTKVPYTVEVGENSTFIYFERNGPNTTSRFYLGTPYKSRYIPTRPFRYTENGIAITTDRVRVNRLVANVANTKNLTFKIISPYVNYEDQKFEARIVGDLNNLLGVIPFFTGDVEFSYGQNADEAECEFYTDDYFNLTISGLSWSGQYHEAGNRM